ncbi:energy transducer TonB [Candidatus Marinarcus aquaticus]|uniref:TonB C-terminal domain-containing protein n=1 Tax=Candidatus Marinarcus aquaticus TaxID=2044504 RepID=A0A4Q0XTX8_9BACT|nr:energy transducer TonB [Candidatus Marinarcus aquaticus]RXJ60906.1 hypothetical protein CRV04_02525 [Candidatus Marinarcus aquaticus]
MNSRTIKAFIISLFIHVSLFATFIQWEKQSLEKKNLVVIDMSMIHKNTQIKKVKEKKEHTNSKKRIKQVEQKKIKPKKKANKKELKKSEEKQPLKKEDLKKKPEPKNIKPQQQLKKQEESQKRVKSGESYQQQYIKNNLAQIIAAIKKYKNYPYIAKKRGYEGKVLLQVHIHTDGTISNIQLLEASPFKILNENSIEILKQASKEFMRPEKPITLSIPFNYYLE